MGERRKMYRFVLKLGKCTIVTCTATSRNRSAILNTWDDNVRHSAYRRRMPSHHILLLLHEPSPHYLLLSQRCVDALWGSRQLLARGATGTTASTLINYSVYHCGGVLIIPLLLYVSPSVVWSQTKILDFQHHFLLRSPFHQEHQFAAAVRCADDSFWFEVPRKAAWFLSLPSAEKKTNVTRSRNEWGACSTNCRLTSFFLASVSGSSVDFLLGADFSLMFFWASKKAEMRSGQSRFSSGSHVLSALYEQQEGNFKKHICYKAR